VLACESIKALLRVQYQQRTAVAQFFVCMLVINNNSDLFGRDLPSAAAALSFLCAIIIMCSFETWLVIRTHILLILWSPLSSTAPRRKVDWRIST